MSDLRTVTFPTSEGGVTHEDVSAEQLAWRRLRAQGVNVKAWALEQGFHPSVVYSVLRGQRKCLRGQSYRIAVALGLKPTHF